MKRCAWLACWLVSLVCASLSAQAATSEPKPETESPELRAAVREAVKRYGEIMRERGQDDGGLNRRVEEILARPLPVKPAADAADPRQALANLARVPMYKVDFSPEVDTNVGLTYDGTPDGKNVALQELQNKLAASPNDVPALLQAQWLAGNVGKIELSQKLDAQAVAAARAQVVEKPADAEAHALLAEALGWRKGDRAETLAEARKALAINPKSWRAEFVIIHGELSRLTDELQPEGARPVDEESARIQDDAYWKNLYDHPPDDAHAAAYLERMHRMENLLWRVVADAPDQPEPFYRFVAGQMYLQLFRELPSLLRERKPAQFGQFMETKAERVYSMFMQFLPAMATWMAEAAKMAPGDPRPIATGAFCTFLSSVIKSGPNAETLRQALAPYRRELAKIATESPQAEFRALAAEAVGFFDLACATINKKDELPTDFSANGVAGLLAQAVTLDPHRLAALDSLTEFGKSTGDYRAALALMEIRRAVIDSAKSNRNSAAAAAKMGDYPLSRKFLDDALKQEPENRNAFIWLAGLTLRGGVNNARLDQAESRLREAKKITERLQGYDDNDQQADFYVNSIIIEVLRDRRADVGEKMKAVLPLLDEGDRKKLVDALAKVQAP